MLLGYYNNFRVSRYNFPMNSKLLLLLFALVIASCEAMPPGDIEIIGQDGLATYQSSVALITGTAAAADLERARASQAALATRDASDAEVRALAAQAVGTQTAVSSVLTLAAVTREAELNSTAAAAAATMMPYTITPMVATQQAISLQAQQDVLNSKIRTVATMIWFWLLLPGLLVYFATKVIQSLPAILERRHPEPEPELDPDLLNAIEWVERSIASNGPYSNMLLGYRQVPKWGSAKWQLVKGWCEELGYVWSDSTGTYVVGGFNLQAMQGWLDNYPDGGPPSPSENTRSEGGVHVGTGTP